MIAIITEDQNLGDSIKRYLKYVGNIAESDIHIETNFNLDITQFSGFRTILVHLTQDKNNVIYYTGFVLFTILRILLPDKNIFLFDTYFGLKDDSMELSDVGNVTNNLMSLGINRFLNDIIDKIKTPEHNSMPVKTSRLYDFFKNYNKTLMDPHESDFANLLPAVSLFVGAYFKGELDRAHALKNIYKSIIYYEGSNSTILYSNILILLELIKLLIQPAVMTDGLVLADYLKNKKVLFIDDKYKMGWAYTLVSLFFNSLKINISNKNTHETDFSISGQNGQLICADNPEIGKKILEKHKNTIDLVILDLHFPSISGVEILNNFRKKDLNIPLLIFSSSFGAKTIINALDFEMADSYFCKALLEPNEKVPEGEISKMFGDFYNALKKSVLICFHKEIIKYRSNSELKVFNNIQKWLDQFPSNGRKYALRLLENIRYYDKERIMDLCRIVHEKLIKKIGEERTMDAFFIGIGGASKSGTHILYYYRQENFPREIIKEREKKESVFINVYDLPDIRVSSVLDKQNNFYKERKIILIDDIVVSGNQFVDSFKKILEYLPFLSKPEFNNTFYYLPLIASSEGIDYIIKECPQFKDRILCGKILSEDFKAFSSAVFPNQSDRDNAKEFVKQISIKKELYSIKKQPLPFGYGDNQLLLIWEHNTPNNTLPIFWSDKNGWFPLFPRKE